MRILPLAFGLLAIPACVAPADGTRTTRQDIVGGATVSPTDYPSVVGLEEAPSNWFCTGTLIAPAWVLTAAHCVADGPITGLHVRFDDADINDTTGGTVVEVAEVHQDMDFDWDLWDNDIALLELAAPVTDREPTPIHREVVAAGANVMEVGYGVSDNMDQGGGILRAVGKTTAACAGANDAGISDANLLCMDSNDGKGSCYGDSGGPAFLTVNGKLVVAGVTSGGSGELCGQGWDLYTSVQAELAFVDSVLGAVEPVDPGEGSGSGDGSGSDDDGTHTDGGGDDDGGCNTSGHGTSGAAGAALTALAAIVTRRRRR